MDARKINNQIFVQNLKSFRGINGISQKRLSELIGIHKSTINEWEHGNIHGISKYKDKIEDIFKCPIIDLFDIDMKNKWRVDESIFNKIIPKHKTLTYYGKTLTVLQWCSILKIKPETMWARIRKGYPVQKVLSPEFVSPNAREVTYNGISMTVKEWAKSLGMKEHTILSRLRRGWSIEKSLSK